MAIQLNNPFSFIDTMLSELSAEKYYSLMRASQRITILEWRDREEFPGLGARFDSNRAQIQYGFSDRLRATNRRKNGKPDFVSSGETRAAMMKRLPKSLNNKGSKVAVTYFKYGGGKLNFLTAINAVQAESWVKTTLRETVKAYVQTRKNKTNGTASIVAVNSYIAERPVTRHIVTRKATSYAQEWAGFTADLAWMQERVPKVFMELARTGAMRDGKLIFRYTKAAHWNIDFGTD